jgi:hypothetical protein
MMMREETIPIELNDEMKKIGRKKIAKNLQRLFVFFSFFFLTYYFFVLCFFSSSFDSGKKNAKKQL